jgi:hypothetical protein
LAQREKLLRKALEEPDSLHFGELLLLAEQNGFVMVRSKGSHHILKRRGYPGLLNLQNVRGKAKPYQVRQLLEALRDIGLIRE